jgi:hypothetical protein
MQKNRIAVVKQISKFFMSLLSAKERGSHNYLMIWCDEYSTEQNKTEKGIAFRQLRFCLPGLLKTVFGLLETVFRITLWPIRRAIAMPSNG